MLPVFCVWLAGYMTTFVAMQAWRTVKANEVARIAAAHRLEMERWCESRTRCQVNTCQRGIRPCGWHEKAEPTAPPTYANPSFRAVVWPVTLPPFLCRESGTAIGRVLAARLERHQATTALLAARARAETLENEQIVRRLEIDLALTRG